MTKKKPVKKSCASVAPDTQFLGGLCPKKDKTAIEVYYWFIEKRKSRSEVAYILNRNPSTISRAVKKLREKGLIDSANCTTHETDPYARIKCAKSNHSLVNHSAQKVYYRIHGEHWDIKIPSRRLKDLKGKMLRIDENTIRCFAANIQIYSNRSFTSTELETAIYQSTIYWRSFFYRLEHELSIKLIDSRVQNIKLLNCHCAEVRNGLARICNETGDKINVRDAITGKVWLLIDNSHNLDELETIGKESHENMANVVKPFFNDLKDNNIPLPSEMAMAIYANTKQIGELAVSMKSMFDLLKSLLPTGEAKGESGGDSESEGVSYIG